MNKFISAFDSDFKKIAFDVEGTLVDEQVPDEALAMQALLRRLKRVGHYIIVWSSCSKEEVQQVVRKLNLERYVDECCSKMDACVIPDVCFDDTPGALARECALLV